MDEKQPGHPHTQYKHEHPHAVPYWKRAHKDWKFWVAVLLMLLAMAVYIRTDELAIRPNHAQLQQQVP
jgi:hypothetical protein